MSKYLAKLLGESEADVSALVHAFEKLSGYPGTDVKLVLEVKKAAKEHMERLGLDASDTTAEELAHALMSRFDQDNARFTRILGGRSGHSHSQLVPLVIKSLQKLDLGGDCWALRRSSAKKILKTCPPKKVMKHLGYRSVDSLLKREQVDEIFAALVYAESNSFIKNFLREYSKLQPADFERRPVKIIELKRERWETLPSPGAIIGYLPLLSSVIVWPSSSDAPNSLALSVLIMYALQNLRTVSAWIGLNQVNPDFGKIISSAVSGEMSMAMEVNSQTVSWESLTYHYAQKNSKTMPALLEDGLNKEDVESTNPEELLCQLDPGLQWWRGTSFIGLDMEAVVSFNVADVAINYANHNSADSLSSYWLKRNLKDELISRYLDNSWVEDSVLSQLEKKLGPTYKRGGG